MTALSLQNSSFAILTIAARRQLAGDGAVELLLQAAASSSESSE